MRQQGRVSQRQQVRGGRGEEGLGRQASNLCRCNGSPATRRRSACRRPTPCNPSQSSCRPPTRPRIGSRPPENQPRVRDSLFFCYGKDSCVLFHPVWSYCLSHPGLAVEAILDHTLPRLRGRGRAWCCHGQKGVSSTIDSRPPPPRTCSARWSVGRRFLGCRGLVELGGGGEGEARQTTGGGRSFAMAGTVRRRGTSRAALLVCIGLLSVAIGGAFGLEAEQQQQGGQREEAVSPGGDGGRVGDAPSGSASSREPERMSAQSEGRKVPHPAAGAGDGKMGGFDPALVGGIIAAVVIGGGGAYFLLFAGEGKKKFKGDAVFLIGPSGGWVHRPIGSAPRPQSSLSLSLSPPLCYLSPSPSPPLPPVSSLIIPSPRHLASDALPMGRAAQWQRRRLFLVHTPRVPSPNPKGNADLSLILKPLPRYSQRCETEGRLQSSSSCSTGGCRASHLCGPRKRR
jgi:hypothetical protein